MYTITVLLVTAETHWGKVEVDHHLRRVSFQRQRKENKKITFDYIYHLSRIPVYFCFHSGLGRATQFQLSH